MRLAAMRGTSLEALGETSAEEFGLWMAFMEEEPLGSVAFQLAVAQLRAAIANGPLTPPSGHNSFAASDFFPQRWVRPQAVPSPSDSTREPTLEELRAHFGGG